MAMAFAFPDWKKLLRTARSNSDRAVLDRRHVYILPTRAGLVFGITLTGMLVGSINYALSLGFVLTFWLGGLGVVAMLHTWRNLAHLVISAGKTAPVFAGEDARFGIVLADHHGRERLAICLQSGKRKPVLCDIPAGGKMQVEIALPTHHRGWQKPGRITVFTQFPLGLFHAWGYAEIESACLVYPRPAPSGVPLPEPVPELKPQGTQATGGDEDFAGLRQYRQGDSMRRVDWKASAREQGLYTKQFEGHGQYALWLDWDAAPGRDAEARLSLITRWVLDAHEAGLAWGLRLPGVALDPAAGETHMHDCLRQLALFGTHEGGAR